MMFADLQRLNGDEKGFEETLREIAKRYQRIANQEGQNQKSRDVVRMLLQLFLKKQVNDSFLDELERAIKTLEQPVYRRVYAYLAGCAMAAANQEEQAELYWRRAMMVSMKHGLWSTLAGVRLSDHHGTSRDDLAYTAAEVWPLVQWPPEPKVRRSVREGIDIPAAIE